MCVYAVDLCEGERKAKGKTMELSKTLQRIRGLIAKAENLESLGGEDNLNEATACREGADKLMELYGIEEWEKLKDTDTGFKPEKVRFDIGTGDNPFLPELATLVNVVAKFCKCQSVWMAGSGWGSSSRQEYCYVYGYPSDLRYFELLVTTLHLHMVGAIFPSPDLSKSLGENAYELHNAGLNWFDIAQAYGWAQCHSFPGEPKFMYFNKSTGERASWGKSIGRIKAAYTAEIRKRGEVALRIPPSGSHNFRVNAAQGYLKQLNIRLRKIAGERGTGSEVVLRDKLQNVTAAVEEDHPDMRKTHARKATYNEAAYGRGVRHAQTAVLNPEAKAAPKQALS